MSVWEWITVFGFTATILGVFLTIYGMINNKTLKSEAKGIREMLDSEAKGIREILERIEEGQIKAFSKIDETQRYIADLIVREGERTREAIGSR